MSELLAVMNSIVSVEKAIETKKKEIEKRREVIETTNATNSSKKKDEAKIEAIDAKISSKVSSIDKTIDYYQNEIKLGEQKLSDEIDLLRKKLDTEIQKLENKFSTYRQYCQEAIRSQNDKRDLLTEPLEKKKELLQQTMDKTEDDDKTLVRLKVELKQLEADAKDNQRRYQEECRLHEEKVERQRKQYVYEEQQRMADVQRQETYQRQKQLELLASQRAADQAADEAKWARQKEERKHQDHLETLRRQEKEQRLAARERFNSSIYPLLSDTADAIYSFYRKNGEDTIYKAAHEFDTVEDCETYLLSQKDTYDLVTQFMTSQYKKLSKKDQDAFDTKTFSDQVEFLTQRPAPKTKKRSAT
jgi:chromosome segregation ATPase